MQESLEDKALSKETVTSLGNALTQLKLPISHNTLKLIYRIRYAVFTRNAFLYLQDMLNRIYRIR